MTARQNVRKMSGFRWTPKRERAAFALAEGKTIARAAKDAGIKERTIYRWKKNLEFELEVDRLSLLIGISSRAERLRIAMQVVRQSVQAGVGVKTKRDVLDWLKFAQSETDGAKLDIASIFENLEASTRDREEIDETDGSNGAS